MVLEIPIFHMATVQVILAETNIPPMVICDLSMVERQKK